MRFLTTIAAAANILGLVVVGFITASMSRWEWERLQLWIFALVALLLVNVVVSLWARLHADPGRLGRMFRLWMSAKEQELKRRVDPSA